MHPVPIFNTSQTEAIPTATFFPLLTKAQCEGVVSKFRVDTPIKAMVDRSIKDTKIRKTLIHPVPNTEDSKYLYDIIADRVARYNQFGYKFNIAGIYTDLQMLEYNTGDYYNYHIDLGPGEAAHRKLSVIIQLSDPADYEGGEVVFNSGTEHVLPRDQGMIAVFPSYILHKVTPITRGTRYSLVVWVSSHVRFQ